MLCYEKRLVTDQSSPPSKSSSPAAIPTYDTAGSSLPACPLTVEVGEPLTTSYKLHDVSDTYESTTESLDSVSCLVSEGKSSNETRVLVNTALLARIEALEAENKALKKNVVSDNSGYFRIEQLQGRDDLVRFYTGFISYKMLLIFFEFLGPSVNELHYWGTPEGPRKRKRPTKLTPLNQMFLTLIRLKLNL